MFNFSQTGRTALLQASYRNYPEIVELLLKAGAKVNVAESTVIPWFQAQYNIP